MIRLRVLNAIGKGGSPTCWDPLEAPFVNEEPSIVSRNSRVTIAGHVDGHAGAVALTFRNRANRALMCEQSFSEIHASVVVTAIGCETQHYLSARC